MRTYIALAVILVASIPARGADIVPPKGPGLTVQLVAAEPDIVTPINIAFDGTGRLLVIESHSHFRPEGYKGPPADRVRLFEGFGADGKPGRVTTFFEGTKFTMDIVIARDGAVYLATRNQILRLVDTDGDGKADQQQEIVSLTTTDNYPHNAIGGLAFDSEGHLCFGMGENHGAAYTLKGSDGRPIQGEGEGGSIFRCKPDGSELERIARGFWNPFGVTIDRAGRIFAVDNDPHARPPCRLLHVVQGGDYGYQYRYGGYGTSSLVAWNGELPGTLGMVAATGEAPCEVIIAPAHAVPREMVDDLLVTSWGDHRIDRFTLEPRGASFTARRQEILTGGDDFRPVGMAVSPDGWIYASDWVDRSYTLHGKGRIWRFRWAGHGDAVAAPKLSASEQRAESLRKGEPGTDDLLRALSDPDPFIREAGTRGLSRSSEISGVRWSELTDPRQRLGVLLALWQNGRPDAHAAIPMALGDPDPEVRLAAVRWAADESLKQYRPQLEAALDHPQLTTRLFAPIIAAIDSLDRKRDYNQLNDPVIHQLLLSIVFDKQRSQPLRVMALRTLPSGHAGLGISQLEGLLGEPTPLAMEAVRVLAERAESQRLDLIARVAGDPSRDPQLRAEAIAALGVATESYKSLLEKLAAEPVLEVSREAKRTLLGPTPAQASDRPPLEDTDGWFKRLEGPADPHAGRRVFFHPRLAGCYRCHSSEGRGARIGPDLTTIGMTADRRHVLESILQPSKEIAPQYYTWTVQTKDGRSLVGFHASENNVTNSIVYLDVTGHATEIKVSDIQNRTALPVSIMPVGLVNMMTDQELRDLMAYLMQPK